jgi:hypothetical protein
MKLLFFHSVPESQAHLKERYFILMGEWYLVDVEEALRKPKRNVVDLGSDEPPAYESRRHQEGAFGDITGKVANLANLDSSDEDRHLL